MTTLLETDFRSQVVDLAETFGWRVFYVEQSTRWSEKAQRRIRNINIRGQGFPDLTLCRARDGRLLFSELKRDVGPKGGTGGHVGHVAPTSEQQAWMDALRAVPCVEVYLWRPADMDEIARVLR